MALKHESALPPTLEPHESKLTGPLTLDISMNLESGDGEHIGVKMA